MNEITCQECLTLMGQILIIPYTHKYENIHCFFCYARSGIVRPIPEGFVNPSHLHTCISKYCQEVYDTLVYDITINGAKL